MERLQVNMRYWGGQAVWYTSNYNCVCVEFYRDGTWTAWDRQWNLIQTGVKP